MGWKIVSLGTVAVIGACLTASALQSTPRVASDFSLYSTRGKLVHLAELRGRVVVLDFWASWCGPCRAAIPVLDRINAEYRDRGVTVLGINVHDTKDPAQTMQDLGATYTALVGGDQVAHAYGVDGLPTVLVIDADGQIVHREVGYSSVMEQRIGEVLEKELAKTPAG